MTDDALKIFRAQLAELLKSVEVGELELQAIHTRLSQTIIEQLRALPDNQNLSTEQLQAMFDAEWAKSLPKRARILRTNIEAGAKAGPKAARQTFRTVLGEQVQDRHVRSNAKALAEASERISGRVTVDGVGLTKRLRRVDKEVAQEMAVEVQNGIRQRKGILGAARKIEALDQQPVSLPKYLRELEQAARLGKVDEVKALAKTYARRVSQLGEIQTDGTFVASKFSLRTATKKFVADIQKASAKGIDKIVKKYALDKAAYRANVIARSETVEAMRQSYVQQSKGKPGVIGYQWRLSNRHADHQHGGSREDVCDILSHQNAYGLGPGIYPAEHVPKLPHACCLCTCTMVMDRKHFERDEAERGQVPEEMRDHKSPGAIDWLKQNDAAAAKILGPTRHQLLREGVNVLQPNGAPKLVRELLGSRQAAE